jgi:glucose-6-phosphate isomerase
VLDLQTKVVEVLKTTGSPLTLIDLATRANAGDQIETIYKILRHLEANHRGIHVEGDRAKPSTLLISIAL